ncbi:MAG: PIN domain-containing protein [Nanoarchaeota archaeon]
MAYFFDTCVIIEIFNSNPKFYKYKDEFKTFTIFNLAEIYHCLLKDLDHTEANKIYYTLNSFAQPISDDILTEAIEFRINHNSKLTKKQKPLSYADAIGYIYAKHNNLNFLTCDDQFIDLPNVEHIKK